MDLKDKTVIVVSANTGLSSEAIQNFVKMDASKLSLDAFNILPIMPCFADRFEGGNWKLYRWGTVSCLRTICICESLRGLDHEDLERLDILLLSTEIALTDP